MIKHFDVIVVGSGIVGSVAALAIAQHTSLQVAVIDSHSPETTRHRVSAISLASKKIFQQVKVWDNIAAERISPYRRMHVWEENGAGEIDFDCQTIHQPALGYIIEDSLMRKNLHAAFTNQKNIHFLHPVRLVSFVHDEKGVMLTTKEGDVYTGKLLIGADGAQSWVRSQADMTLKMRDYEQVAVVATVKTTLPHQMTAWQRFLSTGPLAFLPLLDSHSCSIVWSTHPSHASDLLALNEKEFCQQLTTAFPQLGEVIETSQRYSFPLHMRHAQHYVKSHIALIGDAAHTIHPLAGQGVNLGLQDAICLAEVIIAAAKKERNIASLATLRRYERSRKGDTLVMLGAVDGLKSLFMSEKKPLITLRGMGLNAVNKMGFLKKIFIQYAAL